MNKILEVVATLLEDTAIIGAGTASSWLTYQPEEPAELRQEK